MVVPGCHPLAQVPHFEEFAVRCKGNPVDSLDKVLDRLPEFAAPSGGCGQQPATSGRPGRGADWPDSQVAYYCGSRGGRWRADYLSHSKC